MSIKIILKPKDKIVFHPGLMIENVSKEYRIIIRLPDKFIIAKEKDVK